MIVRRQFFGDILSVRATEDCIRASKKYTKYAFLRATNYPVQGGKYPSNKVLTEYYEVYPEMEIGWDMDIIDAVFWLAGDTPHFNVRFYYNYPKNKAEMSAYVSNGDMKLLLDGIPGLAEAVDRIKESNAGEQR